MTLLPVYVACEKKSSAENDKYSTVDCCTHSTYAWHATPHINEFYTRDIFVFTAQTTGVAFSDVLIHITFLKSVGSSTLNFALHWPKHPSRICCLQNPAKNIICCMSEDNTCFWQKEHAARSDSKVWRFETTHTNTLDCNPSVTLGPSSTIAWDVMSSSIASIDMRGATKSLPPKPMFLYKEEQEWVMEASVRWRVCKWVIAFGWSFHWTDPKSSKWVHLLCFGSASFD